MWSLVAVIISSSSLLRGEGVTYDAFGEGAQPLDAAARPLLLHAVRIATAVAHPRLSASSPSQPPQQAKDMESSRQARVLADVMVHLRASPDDAVAVVALLTNLQRSMNRTHIVAATRWKGAAQACEESIADAHHRLAARQSMRNARVELRDQNHRSVSVHVLDALAFFSFFLSLSLTLSRTLLPARRFQLHDAKHRLAKLSEANALDTKRSRALLPSGGVDLNTERLHLETMIASYNADAVAAKSAVASAQLLLDQETTAVAGIERQCERKSASFARTATRRGARLAEIVRALAAIKAKAPALRAALAEQHSLEARFEEDAEGEQQRAKKRRRSGAGFSARAAAKVARLAALKAEVQAAISSSAEQGAIGEVSRGDGDREEVLVERDAVEVEAVDVARRSEDEAALTSAALARSNKARSKSLDYWRGKMAEQRRTAAALRVDVAHRRATLKQSRAALREAEERAAAAEAAARVAKLALDRRAQQAEAAEQVASVQRRLATAMATRTIGVTHKSDGRREEAERAALEASQARHRALATLESQKRAVADARTLARAKRGSIERAKEQLVRLLSLEREAAQLAHGAGAAGGEGGELADQAAEASRGASAARATYDGIIARAATASRDADAAANLVEPLERAVAATRRTEESALAELEMVRGRSANATADASDEVRRATERLAALDGALADARAVEATAAADFESKRRVAVQAHDEAELLHASAVRVEARVLEEDEAASSTPLTPPEQSPRVLHPCTLYTDCAECTADASCGWLHGSRSHLERPRCVVGERRGPLVDGNDASDVHGPATWAYAHCAAVAGGVVFGTSQAEAATSTPCEAYSSCAQCVAVVPSDVCYYGVPSDLGQSNTASRSDRHVETGTYTKLILISGVSLARFFSLFSTTEVRGLFTCQSACACAFAARWQRRL